MDATTIQTMLADGNLLTLLDSFTPDRREDFVALNHDVRQPDALITLVGIGASTLVLTPAGLQVVVHDHPERSHAECWQAIADGMRESIVRHNQAMIEIREDMTAQAMLADGIPAPLVFLATGHQLPDGVGL